MAPKARLRSRSSVEHIFELVEHLDEDQLSDLLQDLNSTTDTNVPVSKGVEYFEEHRRNTLRPTSQNVLRPTPSFLNQPHEPVDWPRQKLRPVSGSQWRNSMRIVSSPYDSKTSKHDGALARHQTEPISPPLTASPPLSPPLSPPEGLSSPARRSMTSPLPKRNVQDFGARKSRIEVEAFEIPLARELTPPRDHLSPVQQQHQDAEQPPRPSLSEFGSFSFGFDGTAEPEQDRVKKPEEPVSPQSPIKAQAPESAPTFAPAVPPSPPTAQPNFSRMQTMPLPSFHASEASDVFSDRPLDLRPRTATGDASTASAFNKQRSFRRISRPVFLSPLSVGSPDDLAKKLSAYLFEGAPLSPPPPAPRRQTPPPTSLEDMLKEPVTPKSQVVFGRVERQMPTSGIFQVLTEG